MKERTRQRILNGEKAAIWTWFNTKSKKSYMNEAFILLREYNLGGRDEFVAEFHSREIFVATFPGGYETYVI